MEVIIVGCGRVGSELASLMSAEGHNVNVIDRNEDSFKRLGRSFNGLTTSGSAIDLDVLLKAGIKNADAFVVVTNGDNTNIMVSQIAKKIFNVPNVVARLYDPKRAEIYRRLGLDILSGTTLVASMIRDKVVGRDSSSYFLETKGVSVLEIPIPKKFDGKKVSTLNKKGEFVVATVVKKLETIIPSPSTILDEGDLIIGVVKSESIQKTKKKFELDQQEM